MKSFEYEDDKCMIVLQTAELTIQYNTLVLTSVLIVLQKVELMLHGSQHGFLGVIKSPHEMLSLSIKILPTPLPKNVLYLLP